MVVEQAIPEGSSLEFGRAGAQSKARRSGAFWKGPRMNIS